MYNMLMPASIMASLVGTNTVMEQITETSEKLVISMNTKGEKNLIK